MTPRRDSAVMLIRDTFSPVRLGLALAHGLLGTLPDFSSGLVRSRVYRLLGLSMTKDVFIMGNVHFRVGSPASVRNLRIHAHARISTDVTINCDAPVTIGERVVLSPFVRIYTSTHEIGPGSARSQPATVLRPVSIGNGAWLGLGVTVLPGVTIGHGCVVAAGSVVTDDLPPNCLAGGVPAKVIRHLPDGDR